MKFVGILNLILEAHSAVLSLKDAAQGTGLFMGASLKAPVLQTDSYYGKVAPLIYDLTTPGNDCKMTTIAKTYDESGWNYTDCEYFLDYAKTNKMALRGHVLLWASATSPSKNPKFTREETDYVKLEEFLISYVKKTVTKMTPYFFAWDVINEAIEDGIGEEYIRDTPWSHIPDWQCKVFKAAREAGGPNQELFYNDYNIISNVG